jgi:hypothetical protein
MRKIKTNRSKIISLIFLAVYLPLIFAPFIAPKARNKNIRSECRHKTTVHTYPTININKKSSGDNKHLKGPKKRNYSFPV